jgi:hypothetical protein
MKVKSRKSYTIAVCLSGIFGIIGIQHFYLGKYFLGLADVALSAMACYLFVTDHIISALLFLTLDIIHTVVTTILLLTGSFRDGKGHFVCYPNQKLN